MSGNQSLYKQTYKNTPSTNESLALANESLAVLNEREESNSQALSELQKEFKKERASRRRHTFIATTAIIGTILIAANFQMIAAGLLAAAPIIGIVAGSLAALAAVAGVSFLTYKYRAPIIDGVKHAAEKTVAGAKSLGSTIVDSTKHAAEKTVAGAKSLGSTVVDSTKHAAEKTADGTKKIVNGATELTKKTVEGVNSGIKQITKTRKGSYDLTELTDSQSLNKNFDHIRKLFREVFKNTNKKDSIKYILSEIESLIASKIEKLKETIDYSNRGESHKVENSISELESQRDYISGLKPKTLKKELSGEKIYPKLHEIFSEHYDGIKGIISKSKLRSDVLDNLSAASKENGTRKRSASLTSLESGYETDPSVTIGTKEAQPATSRNNDDVSRRPSIANSSYFDASDELPTSFLSGTKNTQTFAQTTEV